VEGRASALIVAVSEAEPLVRKWRLRYDAAATAGVPAHITVLFPFLPPERLDEAVLASLEEQFGRLDRFDYALTAVRRFDDGLVYLAPEPALSLSRLTDAVIARFGVPAYGGEIADPIPHLTVARDAPVAVLDAVASAVAPGLPIAAVARDVALIVQDGSGRWRSARRFLLADAAAEA
jgi:2'-5' RNA ligase